MADKLRGVLEKQGYENIKKRILISLVILALVIIIFAGYFLLFYAKPCKDENCFFSSINNCKRVSWIKEDAEAVWFYEIKGSYDKNSCKVYIKLLKIKQGKIENEKLQGESMVCRVYKGAKEFPEKKISDCTGLLKEDMQDIIIQEMHNYILKNIGDIKKEV